MAGQPRPAAFARLLNAPFDERLSLVSLLLAGLTARFAASARQDAVADTCYAILRQLKQDLAALPDAGPDDPDKLLGQRIADCEAETRRLRAAGTLDRETLARRLGVASALRDWSGRLRRAHAAGTKEALELLRGYFEALADRREQDQESASAALEAAFDFMEAAFGESQELVIFVTELTVSPAAHAFITENGCERYFRYNKDLLLDSRRAALDRELDAEARRAAPHEKG